MTTWEAWARDTLTELSAPVDAVNVDTLWAWSNAESGSDVMRWNNPLNTTLVWAGVSRPMNSVGVQSYQTEAIGARATVQTLLNGYYPTIVAHLRNAIPHQQWTDACAELGTWGTGCGWLSATFGPAPSSLTGDTDLTPEEHNWLANLAIELGVPETPGGVASILTSKLDTLLADVGKIPTTIPIEPAEPAGSIDLSALIQAIKDNTAQLSAQTNELNTISFKLSSLTLKAQ